MLDRLIPYVPSVLFVFAAIAAWLDVQRPGRGARGAFVALTILGLLARIATIVEPGLCPVSRTGSSLALIALFLALHVAITAHQSVPVRALAMLVLIALLDAASQLVGGPRAPFHPPPRERALAEIHGGVLLLAYAAFALAAVYSLLYLVLYRLMKTKRLGVWFERMPSLSQLEGRSHWALDAGFALLCAGLLLGFYTFAMFRGGVPWSDPKFVVAMLTWALFAAEMVCRRLLRWRGIRVMWMPMAGALVLVVLYAVGGSHPFWSPR